MPTASTGPGCCWRAWIWSEAHTDASFLSVISHESSLRSHHSLADRRCNLVYIKPSDQSAEERHPEANTSLQLNPIKTMITLTGGQITSIAEAVRETLIGGIDSYISSALEAKGIKPFDVSDEQYTEIVDAIFS